MKTKSKTVTRFMDMHSGGRLKTPFTHIYIDAPLNKALEIFKEVFKRNPDNVTCKCCGEDFIYEEHDSLEEATAYDRACKWTGQKYDLENPVVSLEEYFSGNNKVLFITE
jgi:hypothetical protein